MARGRRRRRKNTPSLLKKAPWQINMPLAAAFAGASYFHTEVASWAAPQLASLLETSFLSAHALQSGLVAPLDMAALYFGGLAAVACTIFAIGDIGRKRKRHKARLHSLDTVTRTGRLNSINWREFEFLVAQLYKGKGYSVQEGEGTQDGGIDITLTRNGQKLLVQCKHWRNELVGVNVIRELAGVVLLNKADGGVVVCSGRYSQEAIKEAKQLGIHLVTGADLMRHIKKLPA